MEWEIAKEFDLELTSKVHQPYPHHCLKKKKKHWVKTSKVYITNSTEIDNINKTKKTRITWHELETELLYRNHEYNNLNDQSSSTDVKRNDKNNDRITYRETCTNTIFLSRVRIHCTTTSLVPAGAWVLRD